ncbi:biotin carboxylase N-terminal domain-containing protein [Streptomyces sp. SP17BM10]|uniref:acetyl/propionyl/methylcrotonyl-CoA carboxylase subunit alpha n=1 Tax=Streptomyces sp. SP17BM10 TaxID=3002530 RepID=UPI002E76765F|nr:biotin carboxylase N-terminal domain-containing protein [Streptomyces sp. SP17BM10]MEE1786127.1 biotin carboxylase N-terminal domain-containing protein [Streptomyces sp. SP17BM10]
MTATSTSTTSTTTTITNLLVANRGEIARRVFRTCRALGIATTAVHSDPDADAPHVREADAAVRLPGAAPADTYLRGDLIVRAALDAGADAVHPGYGFLSEDAGFAQAVLDAGLTWVGPPPAAIAAMGSKTAAKRLMAQAGVPVLDALTDPTEADLPVLVKAAAGGGGRGMRVVRSLADLPGELAAARSEAAKAFGSDEVFCERYLPTGRHVEVQLMADAHGTVWAVGDRDCSLQRRHQKVIEEAPAPGIPDAVRSALHAAAVAAARAIGYAGAGTAEFLLAEDGRFHFLEMNTRLQVEHPVTEAVTGLDLVALQLAVAEGEKLPSEPPPTDGCAIEARLYAEDPAQDHRPATGTLHRFELTLPHAEFDGRGLRLDAGVESGSTITPHYDAMLAKVIAWAPTRSAAARRLADAVARTRLHGPATNRESLVRALRHPAFLAGRLHTGFLAEHAADLTAPDDKGAARAALAAALADAAERRTPLPSGWRNLPSQPQVKRYRMADGGELAVRYRVARDGLRADDHPETALVEHTPERVTLRHGTIRRTYRVARYGADVFVETPDGTTALTIVPRLPDPTARTEPGALLAPMPGTVIRVVAAVGDSVTAGQPLLFLEAMKMEHRVTAPADGVLVELRADPGRQVELGTLLAVVKPAHEPEA